VSRVHAARSSSFKDGDRTINYYAGDVVTDEEHVRLLDSWGALVPEGMEHLTEAERTDVALNPDLAGTFGLVPVVASPAGGTIVAVPDEPPVRIDGRYDDTGLYKAADLQREVDARRGEGRLIEFEGSGAGGNVLRADLEAALELDDEARAAEAE
jgi:hypothetical protein